MKKNIILAVFALMATTAMAKDIKTLIVTTTPIMHCESCENKIKGGMRFVKGIKNIETCVEEQTVTITYDADKNSEEKIISSFEKIGYKAEKVNAKTEEQKKCEGNKCEGKCH